MRQTTEITRVKARTKALTEKTVSNGCTEAEAMAVAEMVGRLLERYVLSMEEIDLLEERCGRDPLTLGLAASALFLFNTRADSRTADRSNTCNEHAARHDLGEIQSSVAPANIER